MSLSDAKAALGDIQSEADRATKPVDDRRRQPRSRQAMEVDLKFWRQLRGSWCEIERSSMHLADLERAELARREMARAAAAIARLETQLGGMKPASS